MVVDEGDECYLIFDAFFVSRETRKRHQPPASTQMDSTPSPDPMAALQESSCPTHAWNNTFHACLQAGKHGRLLCIGRKLRMPFPHSLAGVSRHTRCYRLLSSPTENRLPR